MREIGDAVGLTSTSSVAYQLSRLQRKGLPAG
jgi:SOS-response transcriptional repressor LexA